jgi:hypothetical protein
VEDTELDTEGVWVKDPESERVATSVRVGVGVGRDLVGERVGPDGVGVQVKVGVLLHDSEAVWLSVG